MKNFYAVKKGFQPGIYSEWNECLKQVKGYINPVYRKFKTEKEAIHFIDYKSLLDKNLLEKRSPYEIKAVTREKSQVDPIKVIKNGDEKCKGICLDLPIDLSVNSKNSIINDLLFEMVEEKDSKKKSHNECAEVIINNYNESYSNDPLDLSIKKLLSADKKYHVFKEEEWKKNEMNVTKRGNICNECNIDEGIGSMFLNCDGMCGYLLHKECLINENCNLLENLKYNCKSCIRSNKNNDYKTRKFCKRCNTVIIKDGLLCMGICNSSIHTKCIEGILDSDIEKIIAGKIDFVCKECYINEQKEEKMDNMYNMISKLNNKTDIIMLELIEIKNNIKNIAVYKNDKINTLCRDYVARNVVKIDGIGKSEEYGINTEGKNKEKKDETYNKNYQKNNMDFLSRGLNNSSNVRQYKNNKIYIRNYKGKNIDIDIIGKVIDDHFGKKIMFTCYPLRSRYNDMALCLEIESDVIEEIIEKKVLDRICSVRYFWGMLNKTLIDGPIIYRENNTNIINEVCLIQLDDIIEEEKSIVENIKSVLVGSLSKNNEENKDNVGKKNENIKNDVIDLLAMSLEENKMIDRKNDEPLIESQQHCDN